MIRNGLLAVAAVLTLAGCANAQTSDDRDCFTIRSVRGYEVVDDRTVLVRISDDRRYLLETVENVDRALDWSSAIALDAPGNFVCTGSGSGVQLFGGRERRSFLVRSVTRAPEPAQGS